MVAKNATTAKVIEGGRRKIDIILEAIGAHGLDEWSVKQIIAETGLTPPQVWPYVQTLKESNRIHRIAPGRFRTTMARVS